MSNVHEINNIIKQKLRGIADHIESNYEVKGLWVQRMSGGSNRGRLNQEFYHKSVDGRTVVIGQKGLVPGKDTKEITEDNSLYDGFYLVQVDNKEEIFPLDSLSDNILEEIENAYIDVIYYIDYMLGADLD